MMQGHMGQFGPGSFGGYGNFGGMQPYGFGSPGWMAGPDLTWILLLGLIAFAAFVFFKKNHGSTSQNVKTDQPFQSDSQAEELVKIRYARGEISLEEFQTIMNTLRS